MPKNRDNEQTGHVVDADAIRIKIGNVQLTIPQLRGIASDAQLELAGYKLEYQRVSHEFAEFLKEREQLLERIDSLEKDKAALTAALLEPAEETQG